MQRIFIFILTWIIIAIIILNIIYLASKLILKIKKDFTKIDKEENNQESYRTKKLEKK